MIGADSVAHMAKKSLTEHGDKLDALRRKPSKTPMGEVEEVLRDGDKDKITAKTEALTQAVIAGSAKSFTPRSRPRKPGPRPAAGEDDDK